MRPADRAVPARLDSPFLSTEFDNSPSRVSSATRFQRVVYLGLANVVSAPEPLLKARELDGVCADPRRLGDLILTDGGKSE